MVAVEPGCAVLSAQPSGARGTVSRPCGPAGATAADPDKRASAGGDDSDAAGRADAAALDQRERSFANGIFRSAPDDGDSASGGGKFSDGKDHSFVRQSNAS